MAQLLFGGVTRFPSRHVVQFVAFPEQLKQFGSHCRHELLAFKYSPLGQLEQLSEVPEQAEQVGSHRLQNSPSMKYPAVVAQPVHLPLASMYKEPVHVVQFEVLPPQVLQFGSQVRQ